MSREHWEDWPSEQDFLAAESYLSLLFGVEEATKLAGALRATTEVRYHPAKDLLVASRRELLPLTDPEVAADLNKLKFGTGLSPVMLVEGDPLVVADGYHRICVSYHVDDNAPVPCWIVSRRALSGMAGEAAPRMLTRRAG